MAEGTANEGVIFAFLVGRRDEEPTSNSRGRRGTRGTKASKSLSNSNEELSRKGEYKLAKGYVRKTKVRNGNHMLPGFHRSTGPLLEAGM